VIDISNKPGFVSLLTLIKGGILEDRWKTVDWLIFDAAARCDDEVYLIAAVGLLAKPYMTSKQWAVVESLDEGENCMEELQDAIRPGLLKLRDDIIATRADIAQRG
jgi:hypothetical protein